jgi:ATP-dependent DNA helicase RecG
MSRPERLFPLFAELETLEGVGPKSAQALEGLGITRPKDLLFQMPHSGVDRARKDSVREVIPLTTLTVMVEVGAHFHRAARAGITGSWCVTLRWSSWSCYFMPGASICKSCSRPGSGG